MLKPNLLVLFWSLMLRNGDMDVKIDRYDSMVTDVNIIVSKSTELLFALAYCRFHFYCLLVALSLHLFSHIKCMYSMDYHFPTYLVVPRVVVRIDTNTI